MIEKRARNPVLVIGVGAQGPSSLAQETLHQIEMADQLWGSERLLSHWAAHTAQKDVIGANVERRLQDIANRGDERVVILASGDPGFFGIAATVLRILPPSEVEIVPNVSSLQLAFARIGLDWNDAVFTSAHNRSLSEVVGWAKRMPKVGILTDQKNTPSVIAKTLLDCGIADCRAVVAENLGMENEEIIDTHLEQLPLVDSGPLNVLMLLRDNDWRPWPAFSPRSIDSYVHLRGLITKRDVRTLVLARLALRETDIVWDIGAGSGAVSIEMAELAWRGRVYAIEKERENVECMEKNVAKFGTLNVSIIHGTAPDALTKLERPSAVFIGGTGGAAVSILQYIDNSTAPSCKLVACLSTLENLVKFMNILKELGWIVDVTQTGISHSRQIAGMTRFSPLNPVFILSAQKQGNV